jgi:hypothetical protein
MERTDPTTPEIHDIAGQMMADYLIEDQGEPPWRVIGHAEREQRRHAAFTTEDVFWRGCINRANEIKEAQS